MWWEHAQRLQECLHEVEAMHDEALLQEERVQWMRMGAEKHLKDLEAKNTVLMENLKQKNKPQVTQQIQEKSNNRFWLICRGVVQVWHVSP
ncbi:hypothetical protein JVT61DRAFT_11445 [Boletus reticuloceps]|uniref:Uncharacterized protein n=1 Tax=Boletus reticuloceps TaxID=495285 RepID=A0A8I2YXJ0_9AGAM|nr:hypothetical protein JVT61DRAFT_11445 [Boletus reticuloceps]